LEVIENLLPSFSGGTSIVTSVLAFNLGLLRIISKFGG